MSSELVIIVPLILFIFLWIGLAKFRVLPLKVSTHFGFTITLIILMVFGLWALVDLSSSGWLSGMVIYAWVLLFVPVCIVTYLLAIASFTLFHSRKSQQQNQQNTDLKKDVSINRRKVQLSFAFVTLFLVIVLGYFYVVHLESRVMDQQATEASLRALYNNPMVRLFPHLRARLGYHHKTPLDLLAKLFDDSSQDVWLGACRNDKATEELLFKASKSSWPNNKQCVLANPNAPVELLREWSRVNNDDIRRDIARHKNTPPDVLLILSMDDSPFVRGSVAINTATPEEALARLAVSDNPYQRGNVATHANTPVSVLEKLAEDPDLKVRREVLTNSHTPLYIIEAMLNDIDEKVRKLARNRIIEHQRKDRNQ